MPPIDIRQFSRARPRGSWAVILGGLGDSGPPAARRRPDRTAPGSLTGYGLLG